MGKGGKGGKGDSKKGQYELGLLQEIQVKVEIPSDML